MSNNHESNTMPVLMKAIEKCGDKDFCNCELRELLNDAYFTRDRLSRLLSELKRRKVIHERKKIGVKFMYNINPLPQWRPNE